MIRTGLEAEKLADQNYHEYNGKFASISDKLTELNDCVENTSFSTKLNMKEIYCKLMTLQKVIMRIYNMALANNEGLPLNNEFVKATFYDDLPAELQEMEDEITQSYEDRILKESNKEDR